jgi:hypothetical protein
MNLHFSIDHSEKIGKDGTMTTFSLNIIATAYEPHPAELWMIRNVL